MHFDSQQTNQRDNKATVRIRQKEVLGRIDLGRDSHLDSDSEGPDEDYTPEDTQFQVENLDQFLRRMPDLKYAECDASVVQPSLPDGVVNDVPCTI